MAMLKELRERAGLSRNQVENRLNLSKGSVYRWESGRHKPCMDALINLIPLYKCTLSEIFNAVIKK